jgi:hypothetical protein
MLRRATSALAVLALALLGVSAAAPASATSVFTISGHVQNDISGYAAGTVEVSIGVFSAGAWHYSTPQAVATDGTYSASAAAISGVYDLRFSVAAYGVPLFTTYFDAGLNEPLGTDSSAPGIIASVDATDDVTLVAAGYITGTVSTGTPPVAISGENVEAFDINSGDEFDAQAPTSPAGAYSIKVTADASVEVGDDHIGTYYPQFYDHHDLDPSNFDPVTVSAGNTKTGIDFDLVPVAKSVLIVFDVVNNPAPQQPADNVTVKLTVLDGLGNTVQPGTGTIHGGTGVLIGTSVGDYQIQFTNSDGKRIAIDRVFAPGSNPSPDVDDPFFVPGTCSADLGAIDQSDLDAGLPAFIDVDLNPDLTICNAAAAAPTLPKHRHHFLVAGAAPGATATPTPTPTATPTPADTPTPSATTTFTATPTPKPVPAVSTGGLPWWVWLLIVVGILILAGIAFALIRRR